MSDQEQVRKSCANCELCVMVDYGYSNYTVEGTNVYCIPKRHPNNGFDRWYGKDEKIHYAEECELFTKGVAIEIDVDCENINTLTTHQRTLYEIFENTKEPRDSEWHND